MPHVRRLLALVTILVSGMLAGAADLAKPNIILLLADEIGYGDLGCYGASKVKTPRQVVGFDPADPIRLDDSVKRVAPDSYLMDIPRIGAQTGGRAALWKDDEFSLVIAAKGRDFIARHRGAPIFLYLATHNIHIPRVHILHL